MREVGCLKSEVCVCARSRGVSLVVVQGSVEWSLVSKSNAIVICANKSPQFTRGECIAHAERRRVAP